MHLIKFGLVNLPEPDGEHGMPVGARDSLILLQNGAYDPDGGNIYFEPQRISARFLVLETDIDAVVNELSRESSKGRNILRARLRDGSTEWVTYAKLLSIGRTARAEDYRWKQSLTMTFKQDYPYWIHGADGLYFNNGHYFGQGLIYGGRVENQTMNASPHTFTINNTGGVPLVAGSVTIKPSGAGDTITNPLIENLTNGMSFQWNGTLVTGDTLYIDFLSQTVEKNTTSEFANFVLGGVKQIDFMRLELGNNNIRVTGSALNAPIKIYWQWKRHYL